MKSVHINKEKCILLNTKVSDPLIILRSFNDDFCQFRALDTEIWAAFENENLKSLWRMNFFLVDCRYRFVTCNRSCNCTNWACDIMCHTLWNKQPEPRNDPWTLQMCPGFCKRAVGEKIGNMGTMYSTAWVRGLHFLSTCIQILNDFFSFDHSFVYL